LLYSPNGEDMCGDANSYNDQNDPHQEVVSCENSGYCYGDPQQRNRRDLYSGWDSLLFPIVFDVAAKPFVI